MKDIGFMIYLLQLSSCSIRVNALLHSEALE